MPDKENNKKELYSLLSLMEAEEASDLFITVGLPPTFKVHGKTLPVTSVKLTSDQVSWIALQLMDERHKKEFNDTLECNFALDMEEIGRFRVNVFQQKNQIGMVLRKIKTDIPEIPELGLPNIVSDLTLARRGLVIVAGPTGTGKSTTLAAMIGYRNQHRHGHIITIEDPIEYIHEHGNC
ncbi:MAG: Flp pilus assembly complex ATPase component, partial [Gammaproteobacteria bacterium]|nr:Flp pilus assembly complex ATPase component [Gammaproteobacteria bacterium]